MHKKCIIINCQNLGIQSSGGAGRYAAELHSSISSIKRIDNTYIFENVAREISPLSLKLQKNLRSILPGPINAALKYLQKKMAGTDQLLKCSRDQHYDEILLHELTNFDSHPDILKFKESPKAKVLVSFLDLQDFQYPQNFSPVALNRRRDLYKLFAKVGDHFIAISEYTKQTMVECLGIPANKISVVYLGTQQSPITEDKSFEGKVRSIGRYLIYPAKFWPHKNHEFLFSCLGNIKLELQKSGIKIILCAGFTAKEDEALNRLIKKNNLAGIVESWGYVGSNELRILLANAEFLIFPSLYEGFGMPLIEAMSLDCPILSSSAAALPEIGQDAPLYFNPSEEKSLIELLLRVVHREIDRDKMIAKGRIVVKRYSWETCCLKTLEVYRHLLNRSTGNI